MYEDATASLTLVIAKTRIAPLTISTTPRLELCGAQLLSKLLFMTADVLSIPIENVFAWCDSTIALYWLNTPPAKLKTYICNRVVDTISRVPASQWRHVPTQCNPADIASRGSTPSQLMSFSLWWNGPDWLRDLPDAWPVKMYWKRKDSLPETKPAVLITSPPTEDVTIAFSDYNHLHCIIAWCCRFLHNCRVRPDRRTLKPGLSYCGSWCGQK